VIKVYSWNVLFAPFSDLLETFMQTTVSLSFERPREIAEFYRIRRFRDVSQSQLVADTELLDWRSVYFVTGINVKVDLFYSMFGYLMDTFAPNHMVRVRAGGAK
jgi:hypothetical protein